MRVSGWGRVPVLACILVAQPARAAEPGASEPTPTLGLPAAEIDFAPLAALARGVMRHELDQLLQPSSLALSWRLSRPGDETGAHELRVVLMAGSGVGGDAGALGSTSLGGLAPTIWVYVPTVARALGFELDSVATSLESQRRLGLALGRVLAHEIVHLLAPHVQHADTGIMRRQLHAASLTRGRAALDAECLAALAAGARAWREAGGPPRLAGLRRPE